MHHHRVILKIKQGTLTEKESNNIVKYMISEIHQLKPDLDS